MMRCGGAALTADCADSAARVAAAMRRACLRRPAIRPSGISSLSHRQNHHAMASAQQGSRVLDKATFAEPFISAAAVGTGEEQANERAKAVLLPDCRTVSQAGCVPRIIVGRVCKSELGRDCTGGLDIGNVIAFDVGQRARYVA